MDLSQVFEFIKNSAANTAGNLWEKVTDKETWTKEAVWGTEEEPGWGAKTAEAVVTGIELSKPLDAFRSELWANMDVSEKRRVVRGAMTKTNPGQELADQLRAIKEKSYI